MSNLVFVPKNPILRHCSESYYQTLRSKGIDSPETELVGETSFRVIRDLIRQLSDRSKGNSIFYFLLALQTDYLFLSFALRLFSKVFARDIKIYYLMHEPRLEPGRTHPLKAQIIYLHQFLLGQLADIILVPSAESLAKAKTFVPKQKIRQINLAFVSVPEAVLLKNWQMLQQSWEVCKVFLMMGTVSSVDKNPQGFIDFANAMNKTHPGKAQFIRAGRDRGLHVAYEQQNIIRFPSYLSETTKAFLLGLTHFVVVPYSFSTQSGVITEAMRYGKMIIVNDIPAFACFKGLDFFFFADFKDEDSILDCIDKILSLEVDQYKSRYWSAVRFFQENHSEIYLTKALNQIL
jgi:glycosyltransferase involved in cell wall biosynthesis